MSSHNKLLVVGSTGFLGSALVRELKTDGTDRSQIDLLKFSQTNVDAVLARGFSHVAICAAATDIEFCFKNPTVSHQINVAGTIKLLERIWHAGAVPIFFSTDYAFAPKESPHAEDDEKKPLTLYGKQKLEVENFIQRSFDKFLVFRTSKLMSMELHAKNILRPVVQNLKENKPLKLFEDQWLNPVFVEDIVKVIEKSMQADISGCFHLGTKQIFSRAGLARHIADELGLDRSLIQSGYMKDIVTSEPRPHHNTLNCEKIETALQFEFTEVGERALANLS